MIQKLPRRIFPFIPVAIGIVIVILQSVWGKSDTAQPIEMMFVLIVSCMLSWLFAAIGLIIFKDEFAYYKKIFPILSIIYLFPAIFLALLMPWTLVFSLAVLLAGVVQISREK